MSKQPNNARAKRRIDERASRRSGSRAVKGGGAVLALGAGLVTGASPAGAATHVVTSGLDDDGAGLTLREAIAGASDGDIITFDPSVTGTITLAMGEITIDDQITIQGPGEANLAIDGADASRIFYIGSDATSVTIAGLTIQNGSEGGDGGAIAAFADLTVTDSTFSYNSSADDGGAIDIDGADLTVSGTTFDHNEAGSDSGAIDPDSSAVSITGSTFSYNTADVHGGAIRFDGPDPISVTDSDFDHNEAGGWGGALHIKETDEASSITGSSFDSNDSGEVGGAIALEDLYGAFTVTDTTITGNTSPDGGGIGIYRIYATGSLTVEDSTISGNGAEEYGGGIFFYDDTDSASGPLSIVQSTIDDNTAGVSGGGIKVRDLAGEIIIENSTISGNQAAYYGGGVNISSSDDLTLTHSTITDNYAGEDEGGEGGGLYLRFTDAVIDHTIISGNDSDSTGPDVDINGDIEVAVSNSIIGEVSDPNDRIDDVVNNQFDVTDPGLEPLADNGGPTRTHAVPTTSPAYNTGDPAFAAPPATDQRGEARVGFDVIDVGAYEAQPAPTTPTTTPTTPTTDPDGGVDPTTATPGTAQPATPTAANPTFTG